MPRAIYEPRKEILDWRTENNPGCGKLYDCHGCEIDLKVCYCDLVSGQVGFYIQNGENGYMMNKDRTEIVVAETYFAAPLRFEPKEPEQEKNECPVCGTSWEHEAPLLKCPGECCGVTVRQLYLAYHSPGYDWWVADQKILHLARKALRKVGGSEPKIVCTCDKEVDDNSPRNKHGARRCSVACIEAEAALPDPVTLVKELGPKIRAKIDEIVEKTNIGVETDQVYGEHRCFVCNTTCGPFHMIPATPLLTTTVLSSKVIPVCTQHRDQVYWNAEEQKFELKGSWRNRERLL